MGIPATEKKETKCNNNKKPEIMRELDNNQKARLADYVSGRPVELSEDELGLLAEDDALAAEVLEIAEIASQAEMENEQGKGKTIRMILMSLAACLALGISMGLVLQNAAKNDPIPQKATMASASAPDMGYTDMPDDFEALLQTASAKNIFDHKPDEAFDLALSKTFEGDTLVLCSASGLELLRAKVNGNIVPIEGLSEGLYYYYLIYNPKEKGALAIGWDE